MEGKDVYLSDFERFEKGLPKGEPAFVRQLREEAIDRFAELGIPGPRDEEWRSTPLAPLLGMRFELDAGPDGMSFCHDGQALPEGVLVTTLAEALANHPDLVEPVLTRYAEFTNHPFVALNTAFLRHGLFVHVQRGRVVEAPLYLEHRADASGGEPLRYRRTLIALEENSQATVVESYRGDGGAYFTNAVTAIGVGDGARLDHYKVQEEGPEAFHFHAS